MTGLLPDHLIEAAIEAGAIAVTPWDRTRLQPCSVDLTLSSTFLTYLEYGGIIDPASEEPMIAHGHNDVGCYVLGPRCFVLAGTREKITLDARHAGTVSGKSSLARMGLSVHQTAGHIDPGFSGAITLELFNTTSRPLALWPGMRIAQIMFTRLVEPCDNMYGQSVTGSHYQGQGAPTVSRAWQRFTSDTHGAA